MDELSNNMELYEQARSVPAEARRTIQAGKIKGFTDVNPMWRIKMLTALFGPCGIGWTCDIDKLWLEPADGGEVKAFCLVRLRYKMGDAWSEPVVGIGGSSFIARTKNGMEVSDECYKMAYTDAISVACKSLGIAADVYFEKDRTKYDQVQEQQAQPAPDKRQAASQQKKREKSLLVQGGKLWGEVVRYMGRHVELDIVQTLLDNYDVSEADLQKIAREISDARTQLLFEDGSAA